MWHTVEIEKLKSDERWFHAGALAFILGFGDDYGCHFGLTSSRSLAVHEFRRGWCSAAADCQLGG